MNLATSAVWQQHHVHRALLRLCGIAIVLLPLVGCSKTVRWDEDVVLNTGETITVHGKRTHERGGAPGNPLQSAWYVKPGGTLSFQWSGRSYVFQAHSSPLLIAIAPDGRPVVVAAASIGRWDEEHNFQCTTPHYVQFVPDATGANWSWPAQLPAWLYGLPGNLLIEEPRPGTGQKHYSVDDVRRANASRAVDVYQTRVDPAYTAAHCRTRRSTP
jgi:hypothetical protein